MSDGLYERDILSWSEHQADLLRRLARGERVMTSIGRTLSRRSRTWAYPNCMRSEVAWT
jgi:hypothetical protein